MPPSETSTSAAIIENERQPRLDGPEERPPTGDGSDRRDAFRAALPRMAIGLVIAGVLWLIGLRQLAVVFVVATLVVAVASVSFPPFGTWLESMIGRVAAPVGRATNTVLMALLFAFVFVPVSLVLRLFRRDPLAAPGTEAGSNWVVRRSIPPPELARRQFTLEAGVTMPERRSRLSATFRFVRVTVGLLAVVLVLDFAAGTAYNAYSRSRGPIDDRVNLPAYAGVDWITPYWEDLDAQVRSTEWRPLLGFVRQDFTSEYINTKDLARRTYEAPGVGPEAPSVFFFGGSTAFGEGQRDLYTIPSDLARLAEEDGVSLRVTNYGQPAWVIWQEAALLSQLLTEGKIPDVAVFYDGLNDVGLQTLGLSERPTFLRAELIEPGTHPRTIGRVLGDVASEYAEHSIIFRLGSESLRETPELTETRAENAVELHARAVELIESLAESYGFEAVFLWQPVVFTKASGEEAVLALAATDRGGFRDVYTRATELLEPPIIDITDALDHIPGPTYIDRGHTNEAGAEGVAEAIYPHLLQALEGRSG